MSQTIRQNRLEERDLSNLQRALVRLEQASKEPRAQSPGLSATQVLRSFGSARRYERY